MPSIKNPSASSYYRGTAKVEKDKVYVILNGASIYTPVSRSWVPVSTGDPVLVQFYGNEVLITANYSEDQKLSSGATMVTPPNQEGGDYTLNWGGGIVANPEADFTITAKGPRCWIGPPEQPLYLFDGTSMSTSKDISARAVYASSVSAPSISMESESLSLSVTVADGMASIEFGDHAIEVSEDGLRANVGGTVLTLTPQGATIQATEINMSGTVKVNGVPLT